MTSWPTAAFYPLILPEGTEEKGYTVSSMLYPVLKVLMMPVAAVLFDTLGVARLLLVQSALSLLSALIENKITVAETPRGANAFSAPLVGRSPRGGRLSQAGKGLARTV